MARSASSRVINNNELTIASPESKHIGTLGLTSSMEVMYELFSRCSYGILVLMRFYSLDEDFKSSSYLTEALLDPELGHAFEPNKTAFNKAYNVKEDIWNWFEHPDNRLHLIRFGVAMDGLKNASPANAILEGLVMLY